MKRIAVLTSGGDAPGMNAAIRAIVRTGAERGCEIFGVRRGYAGLIAGSMQPMSIREVGGIIQDAGTVLGTSRCLEFLTEEGQEKALRQVEKFGVEGLIVIGGNGSQAGACALSKKGFAVVGVASTIDNDLFGTEISIGVDTALNLTLEAIDRLKVTASSHERAFLVEVMGRKCGYLALMAGIAGGAEAIVLPDVETDPEEIAQELRAAYKRGKPHAIVVVAEGAQYNAQKLMSYFSEHRERLGFELRATILGHVQRGGSPGGFDRLLATRFGAAAIELLIKGERGMLVGLRQGTIATTPLADVICGKKQLDPYLIEMARILAK